MASRSFTFVARLALVCLAVGAGFGCSTPPKPPELEAFEKLRADPQLPAARKRAQDLVTRSDQLLESSREKWQDGDIPESRTDALMGTIKLKHALALAEQDRAKARAREADAELAKVQDEQARLDKDLSAAKEQVALLRKLNEAASEREKLAQQLTAEQQKAETEKATLELKNSALDKINAAELALKEAETVNARAHAAVPYGAATDMLTRAQKEFQTGDYKSAQTSAEMSQAKAKEAVSVAKPIYDRETESADNKRRAEELARDATNLTRFEVRRDARGALQRLILHVPSTELFEAKKKGASTIMPGKDQTLGSVADLIKKYPNYPVQVIGHTDARGRAGELLALSLARAQAVFQSLVQSGVDAKRMIVSGQGGAEPVSDNKSASGRARNNRIEIVFLYQ